MNHLIVADSCCDLSARQKAELGVETVPLTMMLGNRIYVDDETLDVKQFVRDMSACKERITSACPSPNTYFEAFMKPGVDFCVTLSSEMSGSYNSALIGAQMAAEHGKIVHVFDSKNASAGEALVVLKLRRLCEQGLPTERIVELMKPVCQTTRLVFVLDSMDVLVRNGRLSRMKGRVISALNIIPILGNDENGNAQVLTHCRGKRKLLDKLMEVIATSGKETLGQEMVITHCNNPAFALELELAAKERFHFDAIHILPTHGLSSTYAQDRGILFAF